MTHNVSKDTQLARCQFRKKKSEISSQHHTKVHHIYHELGPYVWGAYNTKFLWQACLFQYCKT